MSRHEREFTGEADLAAALIASALGHRAVGVKAKFLREMIRHAAAGLALLEGERAASEACYRIADMAASCEPPRAR